jgi:pimeloyl-ACP methyl ester carboxylesterase
MSEDGISAKFKAAEQRLLSACGIEASSRRVELADPPLAVRVLEAGQGPPVVLVHGSGMSATTWAPLMPYLAGHRLIAVDLPGFGLSEPFDYGGRSLREHAVAQLTSLLEALGLERAAVVGTSLGGMWALCLAVQVPFFTALSTPGVRHVVARIRSPNIAVTRASLARGAIGPVGANRAPDGFFAVVHEGMRQRGYRRAMLSHMWLAMRRGHPLPHNFLSESELQAIAPPVLLIWGDADPYGPPAIGQRAAALIPNAELEVIPGRHAPFLDDPERCAEAINDLVGTARNWPRDWPPPSRSE